MPKLVIHYFNFPFWRAEVSRLALHLGKVIINLFLSLIDHAMTFYPFKQRLNLKTKSSRISKPSKSPASLLLASVPSWRLTEKLFLKPEPLLDIVASSVAFIPKMTILKLPKLMKSLTRPLTSPLSLGLLCMEPWAKKRNWKLGKRYQLKNCHSICALTTDRQCSPRQL